MCNVHLARFCGYPSRCWPLHHLSAKLALDEIVCHITVLTIYDKTQIGQLAHHWIRNVPSYPLVFVTKLYHTQEQGYINQVEHSGRKTGDNTEFSFSVLAATVTRIGGGRTAARQPACLWRAQRFRPIGCFSDCYKDECIKESGIVWIIAHSWQNWNSMQGYSFRTYSTSKLTGVPNFSSPFLNPRPTWGGGGYSKPPSRFLAIFSKPMQVSPPNLQYPLSQQFNTLY